MLLTFYCLEFSMGVYNKSGRISYTNPCLQGEELVSGAQRLTAEHLLLLKTSALARNTGGRELDTGRSKTC